MLKGFRTCKFQGKIFIDFSTWRIYSREQRKKQLDWLATNTDNITNQSHSLFACSREQIRQVENRLNSVTL